MSCPRGTISNWEIDRSEPDSKMLGKIANFFDVSLDYLITGKNFNAKPGIIDDLTEEEKKHVTLFIEFLNFKRQSANKMSFGARLKELRIKQDLTQEELAQQLGYHRSTLANWEIDRSDPDFEALKKIALFFNTTVDYLLFGQLRVFDPLSITDDLSDEEKKQVEQFVEFLKSRRQKANEQKTSAK